MAISSRTTHVRMLCGASAAAILAFSGAAQAQGQPLINIAPQSLATALYEFGGQTGRQVLFTPDLAATKVTRGVSGATDQQLALAQILEGTGLTSDTYAWMTAFTRSRSSRVPGTLSCVGRSGCVGSARGRTTRLVRSIEKGS